MKSNLFRHPTHMSTCWFSILSWSKIRFLIDDVFSHVFTPKINLNSPRPWLFWRPAVPAVPAVPWGPEAPGGAPSEAPEAPEALEASKNAMEPLKPQIFEEPRPMDPWESMGIHAEKVQLNINDPYNNIDNS